MNSESTPIDQAYGLRCYMRRRACLVQLKAIQVELQQTIVSAEYKDADRLMLILKKARIKLEETAFNQIN